MERECNKCIHHTSGMCSSWDCKMQTVEGLVKETRDKAIEEFAEACKNHIFCQTFGLHQKTIDEIARELKGE